MRIADESGRDARDRSSAPPPEGHEAWVAEGLRLREVQDLVLRVAEEAERTIRTASAMKSRALSHLGVLADQEAAHAERVDDVTLASSRAVEAAHRSGIAEVATAIHVPEGTVRRAWEDARTTTEEHPALWRALLDGHVSERHVRVALEELTTLPVAARGPLEAEILAKAPTVTAASLHVFARRRRELRHPESVDVRHRRARASRHVLLAPPRDGMSTLTAHLPAVAAHAIYNRCTDAAMAVQAPDDPRTLTQLRADAFMAYALADGALLVTGSGTPRPSAGPSTDTHGADLALTDTSGADGSSGSGSGSVGVQGHGAAGDAAASNAAPGSEAQGHGAQGRDVRMLEAAYVESLGDDDAHAASAACDIDIYEIVPTVAVLVPVDWLADDAATTTACTAHRRAAGAPPDRTLHDGALPDGGLSEGALQDGSADHCEPPCERAQHGNRRDERLVPTPVGEIVGAGPIDREAARALVAQSPSLRRILTDPHTGVPVDMSRSTYRVPAHLRAFTQLRDATCRFPSCRRRAEACDLDHVEAWEEGGATSASNLAHLCRMHHRLKHAGAWSVQVVDDARATRLRDALRADEARGAGSAGLPGHPGHTGRDGVGCESADCDSVGRDGQHGRPGGRLTPSTLRWTSPTGRTSTTRASLDPTFDDAPKKRASEERTSKEHLSMERASEGQASEEHVSEGHVSEDRASEERPAASGPPATPAAPDSPATPASPDSPSTDVPF